jgi:hypothetical protein
MVMAELFRENTIFPSEYPSPLDVSEAPQIKKNAECPKQGKVKAEGQGMHLVEGPVKYIGSVSEGQDV